MRKDTEAELGSGSGENQSDPRKIKEPDSWVLESRGRSGRLCRFLV